MQRRGPIGIAALVNPENPYQSTGSLWVVGIFFGMLVVSCWIYLHWVWAREPDVDLDSPPGSPRVLLGPGEGWTASESAPDEHQTRLVDLVTDDRSGLVEGLHRSLVELSLLDDLVAALDEDVVRQAAVAIGSLLDAPLGTVVADALHRHPEVHSACLRTVGRPGAHEQVVVSGHALEVVRRPTVELALEGVRTPMLDVALSVALTVDNLTVDVADGQVGATGGTAGLDLDLSVAHPGGPWYGLLNGQNLRVTTQAGRLLVREGGVGH